MEYLAAIFMIITGFLFGGYTYQKNKRKDAEAENLLNGLKVDDAKLQQQKDEVNTSLNNQVKPVAPELTPEQVENYWNNKDKK